MRALPEIDYDVHPAYDGFRRAAPALRDEALARLAPVLKSKRHYLGLGAAAFAARAAGAADSTVDALARDGAVGMRLDEALLAKIRSAARPLLDGLDRSLGARRRKGKRLRFRDTQSDLPVDAACAAASHPCTEALESLIRGSGVLDIAEAYYPGFSARLHAACVRQNVDNQPFFTLGEGRTDPKTFGMHFDSASTASLNGVIYLSDVGPRQGPFQYVRGSNRWDWDLEDRAIRKAVDEVAFPPTGDAAFLALPPELRRRATFGADLLDSAPESEALLSRQITFCSDRCDMALFDAEGVHRGGDVREGFRSSVLFVLAIEPTGGSFDSGAGAPGSG